MNLPLTRGFVALIDDADAELCGQLRTPPWRWQAQGAGARVRPVRSLGGGQVVYLARWIAFDGMPEASREQVHYRNGNTLDCRRDNLVVGEQSAFTMPLAKGEQPKHNVPTAQSTNSCTLSQRSDGTWQLSLLVDGRSVPLDITFASDNEAKAYAEANKLHYVF